MFLEAIFFAFKEPFSEFPYSKKGTPIKDEEQVQNSA